MYDRECMTECILNDRECVYDRVYVYDRECVYDRVLCETTGSVCMTECM